MADAFDAITSSRPYRQARSIADAREELLRHAGSQFDPACVRALLGHLDSEDGDGEAPGAGSEAADAAVAASAGPLTADARAPSRLAP